MCQEFLSAAPAEKTMLRAPAPGGEPAGAQMLAAARPGALPACKLAAAARPQLPLCYCAARTAAENRTQPRYGAAAASALPLSSEAPTPSSSASAMNPSAATVGKCSHNETVIFTPTKTRMAEIECLR